MDQCQSPHALYGLFPEETDRYWHGVANGQEHHPDRNEGVERCRISSGDTQVCFWPEA